MASRKPDETRRRGSIAVGAPFARIRVIVAVLLVALVLIVLAARSLSGA